MTKIAITGGIGSGKSYVCKMLEKRGIHIYDCDMAAKRIMATSCKIRDALTNLIGPDTYINEKPNKGVIAKYLLASNENAGRVNNIVHPAVAADFNDSGMTWMECAILFTSGFNRYVDKVICVTAPRETRISRIMKRDSITSEKAEEWIDCQMSQNEVASKSDFIIVNDGRQDVEKQIENILNELNL